MKIPLLSLGTNSLVKIACDVKILQHQDVSN